ncbi:MAG TPA: hypothetical protein VJ873_11765 [bacterium]|nr:hypothetical protein [bacterium]
MKKILTVTAALALMLFVGRVFAENMGKSMKCEVVDIHCYMTKGAKGEAHKACAAKCISGGGELALLYKGKLYIPVDQDFHSARDQFATKGGEMVDVTGKTVSKSGLNYLVLSDAAAAPAAK